MPTIMPPGTNLKDAVAWISEELKNSDKSKQAVVNDGIFRFDLDPLQAEFITNLFLIQDLGSFEEIDGEEDSTIVGITEIDFEVRSFRENTLFGKPLESTIAESLEVTYSPEQDFVMLYSDSGQYICVKSETIFKIAELLRK